MNFLKKNKEHFIIDTTFVDTPNLTKNKYNGFKHRKGSKLTFLINSKKEIFCFELLDGNKNDIKSFSTKIKTVLSKFKPNFFYGDKAYDSKNIKNFLNHRKIKPRIHEKRKSNNQKFKKKRVLIEHFFGNLKQFKEVRRSYFRKEANYLFSVKLALVLMSF